MPIMTTYTEPLPGYFDFPAAIYVVISIITYLHIRIFADIIYEDNYLHIPLGCLHTYVVRLPRLLGTYPCSSDCLNTYSCSLS